MVTQLKKVMFDKNITGISSKLYYILDDLSSNKTVIEQKDILEDLLGCSHRTLNRRLRELSEAGYVEIIDTPYGYVFGLDANKRQIKLAKKALRRIAINNNRQDGQYGDGQSGGKTKKECTIIKQFNKMVGKKVQSKMGHLKFCFKVAGFADLGWGWIHNLYKDLGLAKIRSYLLDRIGSGSRAIFTILPRKNLVYDLDYIYPKDRTRPDEVVWV